jgi:glycolate oxidase FAD binding subunit
VTDLVAAPDAVDGMRIARRVTPTTPDELAAALHEADAAGARVIPLGGGTQLDLGMPPRAADLGLETRGLDRIVEYEPADLTVTVEAGISLRELQRVLGVQGQHLALDPSVGPDATIGGVIATNASGPLRLAHGTARDLVIGTRVANPDGTLTRAGGRVVKNVAGYDLNKLHIGALGTLGVLVELSFKLAPLPPAAATIAAWFGGLDGVASALASLVRSSLGPLAVELLNAPFAQAAGLPAATAPYLLVVRVGGYPAAVARLEHDVAALLATHGGAPLEESTSAASGSPPLWDALATARLHARDLPVVLKATAPIAQVPALVARLQTDLGTPDAPAQPLLWAHAGSGVVYAACPTPPAASVLAALRQAIVRLGGNAALVVERCPVATKAELDVWGDVGTSLALMRALKTALDPNGTLNPGRYVGGI